MNNLFRKYNQNRRTFWSVIIIIAFFIILLHAVFAVMRASKKAGTQNLATNSATGSSSTTSSNANNITSTNSSSSSGTSASESIVNEFVSYCNNNDVESAYNMLTTDCKHVLFPTQDDFEQNYVQKVFTQKRTAKVETSMYGQNIYVVTYYSDILSNGGYNQEDTLQDYIFFTDEDGETKISLNKFLYIEEINANSTNENVYINVIKKEVYVNYEIYTIQVTNQSDQTILLSKGDTDSVYIVDENDVTYSSYVSELSDQALTVGAQQSTIISIKFNKVYNTERIINAIVFSGVIVNYEDGQAEEEMDKVYIGISI